MIIWKTFEGVFSNCMLLTRVTRHQEKTVNTWLPDHEVDFWGQTQFSF